MSRRGGWATTLIPLALAAVVSLASLFVQWRLNAGWHEGYERDVLPAFDAYAYMAMTQAPLYFTVAPWGYRLLTPWLVWLLPLDPVTGFHLVSFGGLLVAGVLFWAFLRRLGHASGPCLLAVVALAFLGPTSQVVAYLFLVDPVTLALAIAFLLCLAGAGSTGLLALIAVLGALSREVQVLLLPLVFLARREPDGARAALRKTVVVGLAAGAATLLVRTWTPLPAVALGRPGLDAILFAWRRDWPETWRGALLYGLMPLALAGACLRRARPFLRRYGYGLAVTLLVPFVAFANAGDPRVVHFGRDSERLLLYAIPFLMPLALHAVDAVRGRPPAVVPLAAPLPVRLDRALGAVAAVLLLAVGFGLDRYRRLDLRGTRDGPLVLAFCRESLASAHRLERGRFTVFDPGRDYFVAGQSDARDLGRMRWYLRDGWGPRPSSISAGEVVMQEARATLVLPCLEPGEWQLALVLSAPGPATVRVDVNGREVGLAAATAEPARHLLPVPPAALFRGDNLIGLSATGPAVRLHRFTVRPAGATVVD